MPTARISPPAHQLLRRLARESGLPMQAVIENVLELYRRKWFLEETNRAFEALRADAEAWRAEEEERAAWDTTLPDGRISSSPDSGFRTNSKRMRLS